MVYMYVSVCLYMVYDFIHGVLWYTCTCVSVHGVWWCTCTYMYMYVSVCLYMRMMVYVCVHMVYMCDGVRVCTHGVHV